MNQKRPALFRGQHFQDGIIILWSDGHSGRLGATISVMPRAGFRSRTETAFAATPLITAVAAPIVMAGIRGAGKYNGVVYYDRWDNCCLFIGVYLM